MWHVIALGDPGCHGGKDGFPYPFPSPYLFPLSVFSPFPIPSHFVPFNVLTLPLSLPFIPLPFPPLLFFSIHFFHLSSLSLPEIRLGSGMVEEMKPQSKHNTQLMLTNPCDVFRGQLRSPNMIPFHTLRMVFY